MKMTNFLSFVEDLYGKLNTVIGGKLGDHKLIFMEL
jgi:hypothetical protein